MVSSQGIVDWIHYAGRPDEKFAFLNRSLFLVIEWPVSLSAHILPHIFLATEHLGNCRKTLHSLCCVANCANDV